MFLDIVDIEVRSGKGGDGAISFHREKYISAGGPDGGDGGKGGDIIFQSSRHLNTLISFKYKRKYFAANGENGKKNNCAGKNAKDIIIKVPCGTIIKNKETNKIIVDMSTTDKFVIAKGGRGGKGNQHFATPTRQVPKFATFGKDGVTLSLTLELKLLADAGLIGFPNVGKSTLISKISNAKPKIANYPFTTLTPSLGVVNVEGSSFVLADIPGIIEGASEGQGLGDRFLRHVERCRMLINVIDVSETDARDSTDDFEKINYEIAQFSEALSLKPQIVVANKLDIATETQINKLKKYILNKKLDFYLISAATGEGLETLKYAIAKKLNQLPQNKSFQADDSTLYQLKEQKTEFEIKKEKNEFIIKCPFLIKILESIDIFDYEAIQYFEKILKRIGIESKLKELGAQNGDTVKIDECDFEFEYIDYSPD